MPANSMDTGLTRREILAAGLATVGAISTGATALARGVAFGTREGDYGPFKMGLQSYSLRGYTKDGKADVGKALAVTKELGVHYWEAYPDHMATTADPAKLRAIKEETEGAGVQVIGYGVVHLGKDEAANRKILRLRQGHGLRLPLGRSRSPEL